MNTQQLQRYSRHIRLPELGVAGQDKLYQARVLVVGMGGLGSPAAMYLAAAGIGQLGIADFDAVESHNLQRQIIHSENSIGESKLNSAAQRLRAINSDLKLQLHDTGVQLHNAIELFSQYDLIVDGCDNFPTRYLNNDAAFFAKKPLVYGSIYQFEGQVSLFDPHTEGPCYRCLFPELPEPGSVPNCDQAGVLGALCGIVGSYQAIEAVKYISGIGDPLRGRLLVIDSLSQRHTTICLKRDPKCPLCGEHPQIKKLEAKNYEFSCKTHIDNSPMIEVDVQQAKVILQSNSDAILIDVREDFEREICSINGSRHIPMGQIDKSTSSLPKEAQILVYCHHGMRSLKVTEFLRAKGFDNALSISGGIDAWAHTHDPQMARY